MVLPMPGLTRDRRLGDDDQAGPESNIKPRRSIHMSKILLLGVLAVIVVVAITGNKLKPTTATVTETQPTKATKEHWFVKVCKKYPVADWRADLGKLTLIDYAGTSAIEVPESEWALIKHDTRVGIAASIACVNWYDRGEINSYVISDTSHAILGRIVDGNYW
jgi:hypothetical protein